MWDLPRPGLEPVSPASAGRFSTTAPPGKPTLLIIILNNPLVEFLLLILATLSSADLEDLVLKGGILPLGHARMIPLNWKMRLPLGYFGLSCH